MGYCIRMKSEVIYVRLDPKLKKMIDDEAKTYHQSTAAFVRNVLKQWFPMQASKKLKD